MNQFIRRIKKNLRHLPYWGNGRYCPICHKNSSKFGEAGLVPRCDAQCRYCGSLERHRLTWLYLEKMTDLFNGRTKQMLHVAPEPIFEQLLTARLKTGYLTADLYDPHVMINMDITNIQYKDQSFDVIYCSHVLEHVPDDRKALREFFRTLKADGWAILLVPIIDAEQTFEEPSITDPAMRRQLFGQEDHVRLYGTDFKNRLEEAGFTAQVVSPSDFLSLKAIESMGITQAAGKIYFCTKP